jgi:hypothetical protein
MSEFDLVVRGVALTEGLSWEWETFPQYLDGLCCVDGVRPAPGRITR